MSLNKLKDKLLRVERTLNIYSIVGNKLISEISIDHIPFSSIEEIICLKENDPLLYDGYVLSDSEIEKLNFFLSDKLTPDFKLYFYVLEASGIYDWEK